MESVLSAGMTPDGIGQVPIPSQMSSDPASVALWNQFILNQQIQQQQIQQILQFQHLQQQNMQQQNDQNVRQQMINNNNQSMNLGNTMTLDNTCTVSQQPGIPASHLNQIPSNSHNPFAKRPSMMPANPERRKEMGHPELNKDDETDRVKHLEEKLKETEEKNVKDVKFYEDAL